MATNTPLNRGSIAADHDGGLDYQWLKTLGVSSAAVSGTVTVLNPGSIAAEHSGGADFQIVKIVA